MTNFLEEAVGAILGILVVLDIFLLVLYARANYGTISRVLTHNLWRSWAWLANRSGRHKTSVLSFSGPIILVALLLTWALLLSISTALMIQPNLGTGVTATSGQTAKDFITALYVGGSSLSFVGASDYVPQTPGFRLFFLLTSLLGVSIVSLTITYLMAINDSLKERNSHALALHMTTAETGDAVEAIVRLGPQGQFDSGYQVLAQWANETVSVKESYGFHDILFYFRGDGVQYSVARMATVSLDTVALIKTALDDKEFGWLKESSAVEELGRSQLSELKTLAKSFIPGRTTHSEPDERKRQLWRRRYKAAVQRLQKAGIKTKDTGAEEYISLRGQWDEYVDLLAAHFLYDIKEVDPALAKASEGT
jgi:hypothetical protein